jgi:hypothetical protein
MKMKPEEREAAMLEYYGRMEKADLAFEKEWGGYLIAKRTHDAVLRKAEDEVYRLRNSNPTLDDDVVEIHSKTKKEGVRITNKSVFGVDHEWISGETGDIESAEETAARMKLWKWLEKSLEGGPCKHLAPACAFPGDVISVYFATKEKCSRVTVLTYGLASSDFFRKDKFLQEPDPQIIFTSLKQEASTLEEMGKRLKIPKTVHPEIIKSQLMVALMMR